MRGGRKTEFIRRLNPVELLLTQPKIDYPAPANVLALRAAVAQDVLIATPRLLQRVGQHGQILKAPLVVNGGGEFRNGPALPLQPGRIDAEGPKRQRSPDVAYKDSLGRDLHEPPAVACRIADRARTGERESVVAGATHTRRERVSGSQGSLPGGLGSRFVNCSLRSRLRVSDLLPGEWLFVGIPRLCHLHGHPTALVGKQRPDAATAGTGEEVALPSSAFEQEMKHPLHIRADHPLSLGHRLRAHDHIAYRLSASRFSSMPSPGLSVGIGRYPSASTLKGTVTMSS